ncbi:threonyl-trna synthetase [Phaffia rhodozyma]|uniref:Probable threonine--tRNA ligase, cytoplasmic n=1 Tax=Phaffia rhodozyma TaxID=264483 RepID=A0A0F7SQQ8_PHARH|nr:threonyl-trna synthetase [Phaffia rhodozyma]
MASNTVLPPAADAPPATVPPSKQETNTADPNTAVDVKVITEGVKQAKIGKQQGEKKAKKEKAGGSGSKELDPPNFFIGPRMDLFEKWKKIQADRIAQEPRVPITITLPDGSTRQGTSWETTPFAIASDIAKSLSEKVVVAKVDGNLWDLTRPLEKDCSLQLMDFDDPTGEAKAVFWHSSAHVLGETCEKHLPGCCLGHGPPIDDGFFYDMKVENDQPILPADWPAFETTFKGAVKEKQAFERVEMPKEALLEMFHYNKYKSHFIQTQVPDGTSSTVYRCGPLIDFCLGPHIPHTGKIKAFSVTKASSAYFLGDAKSDSLQRVYGISFPDSKQMTEYKKWLEEAEKRNHKKIGKDQELFTFHELSPGSPIFLPHGVRIYNALMDLIREEYRDRNYQEVISPNMFNVDLWKQSGHYANYKDDMFLLNVDKEEFALKPMNCPGHCLIFDSRNRSHKELPLRMAEFGVLHRNESSGSLSGLTRVRRFVQDDAHIFCTPDQIESEIANLFEFIHKFYNQFDMKLKFRLSTRNPNKYMGDLDVWEKAEDTLRRQLEKFQPGAWEIAPEDAAFYGPKIDIACADALRREHQVATIQLDFQLPEKFKLKYSAGAGGETSQEARPVMIHRAVTGSLERFIAILTEHLVGKWPFWLSPRQIMVIPVGVKYNDYAKQVSKRLWKEGFYSEVDESGETLNKKIRNAEVAQWNFTLVVGEKEEESLSVNVRNRDDVGQKQRSEVVVPLDELVSKLRSLKFDRRMDNRLE